MKRFVLATVTFLFLFVCSYTQVQAAKDIKSKKGITRKKGVTRNEVTTCTDPYEPNNTFSAAYSSLTSGANYAGKICSVGDDDFFKITIPGDGQIKLNLSVPSDKDYDIELYDSSQVVVLSSAYGVGEPEVIDYTASTGTYYIRVFGFADAFDETQTYVLSGTWPTTTSNVSGRGFVPLLINYQGYLTDKDGNPLPTAEYTLSFSIFNVPTDGTSVWGPQTFEKVPVVKGYFNVILGPNDADNHRITDAFTSDLAYLSISVNGGLSIRPRQRILSAPYAMNAMNGVPVGTVMASMLNETEFTKATRDSEISEVSQRLWTLADGRNVTGSLYASIKDTSSVPDLRGMFLRGINTGRTDGWRDPDGERTAGAYQIFKTAFPRNSAFTGVTSTNGNHTHTVQGSGFADTNPNGGVGRGYPETKTTSANGEHTHTVTITGGDNETCPANAAVYYYIKIN